jgi:hypothetical protein
MRESGQAMRALIRLTISGILLTAIGGFAQTSAPDVNTIANRMQTATADRNHDLAYTVTREYMLTPQNSAQGSKVVAEVNTVASGKKDYTIKQGGGQAESIVRKVLDHETDSAASRASGEITAANYEFQLLGSEQIDGHSCYVLKLTPRKESKDVLRGRAWVDSESYLIRQISGSLAKPPSWWVKDVQLTLHYRDMEGVWLQDSGRAIAQVRIVGTHTLSSRALDVRTGSELASKAKVAPHKATRRMDPSMMGTGVFRHN